MSDMLVNPRTNSQVAQFIAAPSHAVLLTGPAGSGKTHLAKHVAATVLQQQPEALDTYAYFTIIQPDEKGTISIEAIRELQHLVRLKTLGSGTIRRAILIEHAERLTVEAQNAYLKLLEEPPADTLLVLTADSKRSLLPTIISRLQTIHVYPPGEDVTKAYFLSQGYGETNITQAYLMSGGLPGLMGALLGEDTEHPLLAGVAAAKQILSKPQFERLALVDTLAKDKAATKYALEALLRIAETAIAQATAKKDVSKLKQWHHILKAAAGATDALAQNANAKLVLSNLMLSL